MYSQLLAKPSWQLGMRWGLARVFKFARVDVPSEARDRSRSVSVLGALPTRPPRATPTNKLVASGRFSDMSYRAKKTPRVRNPSRSALENPPSIFLSFSTLLTCVSGVVGARRVPRYISNCTEIGIVFKNIASAFFSASLMSKKP